MLYEKWLFLLFIGKVTTFFRVCKKFFPNSRGRIPKRTLNEQKSEVGNENDEEHAAFPAFHGFLCEGEEPEKYCSSKEHHEVEECYLSRVSREDGSRDANNHQDVEHARANDVSKGDGGLSLCCCHKAGGELGKGGAKAEDNDSNHCL